jgi:hypothetical protein
VAYDLGPTVIEKIIAGDLTESVYDLTTGVQTGTKVKGTDIAGGDSMAMAAAIGIGAGISAISNIYGAKKAASVQEKALNQAQANLEKDAQQAEAAWGAWYKRQAPVMQTRNDALMAMRGQYKRPPAGTPDLFTPEFRGWPSAPSQAPQVAQPQATMASVSPGMRTGMGEGGLVPVPMKDGGVVTRPTVALIGEAGPEAVVPLSGSGRMGDIGGGVMPLPPGPWDRGGGESRGRQQIPVPDVPPPPIEGRQIPVPDGPIPRYPPPNRTTREDPLPDWPPPNRTPEDGRRESERLARERRQARQRRKGRGMTAPTDFSV